MPEIVFERCVPRYVDDITETYGVGQEHGSK